MKADTGWAHHVFYSFMLLYVLKTDNGVSFTVHLISELPTVILAIGIIHEPARSHDAFGITFLLSRCVMHACITALYAMYVLDAPLPLLLQLFTLYMHCNFMPDWIAHRLGWSDQCAYEYPEPDEDWLARQARRLAESAAHGIALNDAAQGTELELALGIQSVAGDDDDQSAAETKDGPNPRYKTTGTRYSDSDSDSDSGGDEAASKAAAERSAGRKASASASTGTGSRSGSTVRSRRR